MRLDGMVCHHSNFSFLILFGLAEAEVCFKQMFKCFIMAAFIIPVAEICSASMRLPQLLHFAIPAFFSNLKCNQTFEGYFGSTNLQIYKQQIFESSFGRHFFFENTNVSDSSSFTFRNNFRTKQPLCHELRTTPFLIALHLIVIYYSL